MYQPIEDFLIIPIFVNNPNEYHYEIFTVPIENIGISTGLLKPKIIVQCPNVIWKLCVVKNIVYMFSKGTTVRTFDLSMFLRSEEEEVVLKDEMIRIISPMNSEKPLLEAIPTPGGKVLAFSISLSLGSCFELYDPNTNIWEYVTQMEQYFPDVIFCDEINSINSYTFADEHTLVVRNRRGKPYHLILRDPVGCSIWEDPGWLDDFPYSGFPRGILGGGYELCLRSNGVWDIKNAAGASKAVSLFPTSAFHPSFKTESRLIISGGRRSCCYGLEIAKKSGQRYLSIEEYHLDLVKYFEEKEAIEKKIIKDLEKVDEGSCEYEKLMNRMLVSSPELGWILFSSSTFVLLCPGVEVRLDHETTFSI